MLAAMPALMGFVRGQMRRHRGRGLTVPQFRALIFVNRHPHATQAALAEHIGISEPAASRMVAKLVADKLLARHTHPDDRRAVVLGLTARGRARFDAAWSSLHTEVAARFAALDAGELQEIGAILYRLRDLFGEGDSAAPPSRRRRTPRKAVKSTTGGRHS